METELSSEEWSWLPLYGIELRCVTVGSFTFVVTGGVKTGAILIYKGAFFSMMELEFRF